MTDKEIIKECQSWKGTKWGHNVALKGYKTDCIQFIVAVYINLGLLPKNFKTIKYNRDWALHNAASVLIKTIRIYCNEITFDKIKTGDILIFKYGKCASHGGIYIGNNMFYQSLIRQGVVESNLKDYRSKFVSAWRLKNG